MLNYIKAYKNTGMESQEIHVYSGETEEINYRDFKTVTDDIFDAVNKYDTMNPYNTYNIDTFEMDTDSLESETNTYSITGNVYFNVSSDLKTKYGFSVVAEDSSDLEDEIRDKLLDFFNETVVGDMPAILITNASFTIEVVVDENTENVNDENTEVVGG